MLNQVCREEADIYLFTVADNSYLNVFLVVLKMGIYCGSTYSPANGCIVNAYAMGVPFELPEMEGESRVDTLGCTT